MKLFYIANVRIPTEKAHGIQIMQMLRAFAKCEIRNSKLEVELVVPKRLNKIKENPFEYYSIEQTFKIVKLPCIDLLSWAKYLGRLSLALQILTFYLPALIYLLFKKFDLIYTRDEYAFLFLPWKKQMVWEAHNLPKSFKFVKNFVYKSRLIVAIAQALKNRLIEEGFDKEKIVVAPDGVDLEMFDIKISRDGARNRLNLPLDKKIILYTGHLYEWKGARTLLGASKYLSPDTEIVLVGGTDRGIANFQFLISNFQNVKLIGHRSHSEIPIWLKAADVLILPNSGKEQISREFTSPMKLFEYMASGRPIVASNLPSISEILKDGKNVVLFEADNPKDLADKINEVLSDPILAERISRQAYQDVQNYTWDKRAKKIYESFINHFNLK